MYLSVISPPKNSTNVDTREKEQTCLPQTQRHQTLKLFAKETCRVQTRYELFSENQPEKNGLSADANGEIQEEQPKHNLKHKFQALENPGNTALCWAVLSHSDVLRTRIHAPLFWCS